MNLPILQLHLVRPDQVAAEVDMEAAQEAPDEFFATMKAVLALAMGAAALAPSQPKVSAPNDARIATYPPMTQRQKAADEAAR